MVTGDGKGGGGEADTTQSLTHSLYSLTELMGKSNKGGRIIDKRKVTKLAFVKINSSPFKRFPKSFPTPHSMCGNFSQQNFVFKTGTASQQRESKAALKS